MLDSINRRLVESARDLIELRSDGAVHTVACSMQGASGKTYSGVNVFAQGGGACAELVTLGMAISAGESTVTHVVAVGDAGRGVLAPCGVCRQLLLDYCPDAVVVMPGSPEPVTVPVRELLPDGARSWFAPNNDVTS